jgi:hypothetical protein
VAACIHLLVVHGTGMVHQWCGPYFRAQKMMHAPSENFAWYHLAPVWETFPILWM